MPHEKGDTVYVYGDSEATVLFPDSDGAIVRELDDDSETWVPWESLSDVQGKQDSMSWGEIADLTHETQVEKFNFCFCEDNEGNENPYEDCPNDEEVLLIS